MNTWFEADFCVLVIIVLSKHGLSSDLPPAPPDGSLINKIVRTHGRGRLNMNWRARHIFSLHYTKFNALKLPRRPCPITSALK